MKKQPIQPIKIDIVSLNGDWSGIYVDDKLIFENHELSGTDVLDALKLKYSYSEISNWEDGNLPAKLEDIEDLS